MKNIIFLFALAIPFLTFSQKLNNREKQLFNILKNSYYGKQIDKNSRIYIAKKYACLQKYYNINPLEQQEFLTKSDFIKSYPDILNENPLNANSEENKSFLGQQIQYINYKKVGKKYIHLYYPKCISYSDLNP